MASLAQQPVFVGFLFSFRKLLPSWVEEVCRNEQVLMAAGGGWPLRAVSRIRVRVLRETPDSGCVANGVKRRGPFHER